MDDEEEEEETKNLQKFVGWVRHSEPQPTDSGENENIVD